MTQATGADWRNADEYIGDQVHQLLWRSRQPQRVLGDVMHVDQSTISKKLRGERTWTADELLAVSRFFNVAVVDLLPGSDYDPVLKGRGRGVERGVVRDTPDASVTL